MVTCRKHSSLGRNLAIIALAMFGLGVAAQASEYNFYNQADKKGCASIITERGQSDCAAVQRRKDDLCNVPVDCDPDRQEKTIAKYKEAKERLDSGKVNDSCGVRPSRSPKPVHGDRLVRPWRSERSDAGGSYLIGASSFRREGPDSTTRWALWRRRSQTASATVGSPTYS